MAVTLTSTGIQFPDATIQTTAASGGASTDFDGVGSYAMAYYGASTSVITTNRVGILTRGSTIAGSSLRVSSLTTTNSSTATTTSGSHSLGTTIQSGSSSFPTTGTTTLSGTWRLMGGVTWGGKADTGYGYVYYWYSLLWVRIA